MKGIAILLGGVLILGTNPGWSMDVVSCQSFVVDVEGKEYVLNIDGAIRATGDKYPLWGLGEGNAEPPLSIGRVNHIALTIDLAKLYALKSHGVKLRSIGVGANDRTHSYYICEYVVEKKGGERYSVYVAILMDGSIVKIEERGSK